MSFYDYIKFKERFIVVCEHDHPSPKHSTGPVIMETYINKATLQQAINSQFMFKRFGANVICKLVPLSDDEVNELLKDSIDETENKKSDDSDEI